MEEVYKARDTRLDRFVAVKILPDHLADSPELRERFEREARTIAKLNHPHICIGLAKLKQEVFRATTPSSEMPTVPGALTEHGTLLGTLHYMAPEQVEGKVNEIDARTDIFAFGALVYEMATGKRAFPGETQASVIAKILEVDPPPMSSLQPPGKMTPPVLDRVVTTCLAKDPDERWQTARDVTKQLKWITDGGGETVVATAAAAIPATAAWRRTVPWAMAVLLSVVIGLAAWTMKPTPPQPVSRLAITLPPGQRLAGLDQPAVAISPDGKNLVYVAVESRDVAPASGRPMGQRDAGATGTQ